MSDLTAQVEFVGGPRGGVREECELLPPVVIEAEGGEYVRSVRADDGALRYVWKPGPTA